MGAAETTTTTTPDPKRSAAAKKAAVTRQVNADRAKAKKSRAAATAAKEKAAANRKAAEKPTDAHPEPVSVKDLSDAQRKKLAAKANKYPRRVHRDTRAELHAMGLVAQGLKGRALKLWIEDGETPAETVKRTPPAPKTRKTKTGEKAGPTVQDAVVKVLEKNPAYIPAQYRSPAVWWRCFREVQGCRCPRGYYCASVGTRYQRNSLNKDHGPPRRVTRHEVQRRTAMREEYRCPGRKAAP